MNGEHSMDPSLTWFYQSIDQTTLSLKSLFPPFFSSFSFSDLEFCRFRYIIDVDAFPTGLPRTIRIHPFLSLFPHKFTSSLCNVSLFIRQHSSINGLFQLSPFSSFLVFLFGPLHPQSAITYGHTYTPLHILFYTNDEFS